jgi:hypothetical protein
MEKQFEILRKTRQFLLSLINELTPGEMNTIPPGFNNNIAWNIGHIVAAQQGVCYLRGGMPMVIPGDLFERYKPDSKPQGIVDSAELGQIKSLLLSTIDNLEEDYHAGKFQHYNSWTSRYGITINTIDDAISFLSFHDGLHIGYIMALRRR